MTVLCACGCKQEIVKKYPHYTPKWIQGHSLRSREWQRLHTKSLRLRIIRSVKRKLRVYDSRKAQEQAEIESDKSPKYCLLYYHKPNPQLIPDTQFLTYFRELRKRQLSA